MKKITIEYEESKKSKMYKNFLKELESHAEYTIKQYGDIGEDIITNYSAKECINHIEKYTKRFGNNSRTGQEKKDLLKIVDFAIRIFYKDDLKVTESEEQILLKRIWNENICEDEFGSDLFNDIKQYINK